MGSQGELSVFLIPGMKIKVSMQHEVGEHARGIGYFVDKSETIRFGTKTLNLINGFAVADEKVGSLSLENIDNDEIAVIYTHKRPEKNHIIFSSESGPRGVVSIVAVPIHDHSSIVQGGPAYGTYFSDDEVLNKPSNTD